jgi:hypothetical protein
MRCTPRSPASDLNCSRPDKVRALADRQPAVLTDPTAVASAAWRPAAKWLRASSANLDAIPADVLALWRGNGGESSQEARAPGPATPHQTPQTLWWYVMLLVFVSAIAESVLASRYLGTQREES